MVTDRERPGPRWPTFLAVACVAVAVLGCLAFAVVLVLNTLGFSPPPKTDTAMRQALELSQAISLYRLKHGKIPNALEDLAVASKSTAIMESIPRDPWDQRFAYSPMFTNERGQPYVVSAGADGALFTEDDIGSFYRDSDDVAPYCRFRPGSDCIAVDPKVASNIRASIAPSPPLGTATGR